MVIALNTISLSEQDGHRNFIYECFSRIARLHTQHTFIFICSKPYEPLFIFPENMITLLVKPVAIKPLLLKLWYSYKIPSVLKKYKVSICITSELSCELRTKLPQVLIISDPGYLNFHEVMLKGNVKYYNKNASKFLTKAKMIATLSEFCKNDIRENYKIELSKIAVIYSAVAEIFKPVDLAEKENIMHEYSEGNEYFLFPATPYNEKILLNLLKAFSIFKKWQKSSMQLLIVPGITLGTKEYTRHLRLFKYREDVKLLENIPVEKLAKITAGAYAMIYTFILPGCSMPPMQAMKCNIPVITGNVGVMNEICDDAALYVDPLNQDDIAKKMMTIFKDENLKQALIEKGSEHVKQYSWERTSGLLWDSILKARS